MRQPTGTKCRPDFVAIKRAHETPTDDKTLIKLEKVADWSHCEATGEIRSKGQSLEDCELQGASYTNFLLQARPDLTNVLGIFLQKDGFRLAVSNACGVAYLNTVEWDHASAAPILYAWIYRLYNPFQDLDIDRIVSGPEITFTIRTDGETHQSCKLTKVGTAFGRRTTIFEVPDTNFVIKIQYIEKERRFLELKILKKIHEEGPFPGVVRIKVPAVTQSEAKEVVVKLDRRVKANNGEFKTVTVTRQKTCLVMVDRGIPLMDAETPRDALIALYDLLEGNWTLLDNIWY
jgi:hypothetical protein